MVRLIDAVNFREKLLEFRSKADDKWGNDGTVQITWMVDLIVKRIDDTPTIDPESMRRGQWVSVEDGLPEPYEDVIIAVRDGAIHTAFGYHSSSTGKWYEYDSDGGEQEAKVTHWMPLPDPPEEDCP